MYLGFGTKRKLSGFAKKGEISYGMYLCGWPIQQMVCQGFGGRMDPYLNALLAFPIAILCGILLNRFVEQPIGSMAGTGRKE